MFHRSIEPDLPRTMRRALAALLFTPAPLLAQDIALVNANVVDVEAGRIIANATIVISGTHVMSITPGGAAPTGARAVNLGGRYVLPGLMDAHVHVASLNQAERMLMSGVTTARSMGTSHFADVGLRELGRTGYAEIPEILAAGYHVRPAMAEQFFLDHPELGALRESGVHGADAMRTVGRTLAGHGVDFIKTNATERAGLPTTDPRKQLYGEDELTALVEAASATRGVAAHAHGAEGAHAAVAAGVRSIEHGTYLSGATLRLMAERGTFLVPTIAIVADLTIPGGDYDDALLQIRGRHMLPRAREMATQARQAGVRIVAATDTGYGPESTTRISHELAEFVAIGMSPAEALRSATTIAAQLFGIADRTGRIDAGLEADLIVLERNPLEAIDAVQDVLMVINNGRIAVTRGDWSATN